MKKIVTIAVFFIALISLTNNAQAQKYLSFESKTFSVMLKCAPDYTKLMEISFSENGAWVPYKIVKTLPLDNKTAYGNLYVVEDSKAQRYSVEYIYDKDKDKLKSASCSVVSHKTHVRTALQRKQ
jgi:hypothetical protein